jgi:hypothetical protein
MDISDFSGYAGSFVMVLFAFTLDPVTAIVGLCLLTLQAQKAKLYNLVALNIISVGGFLTHFTG